MVLCQSQSVAFQNENIALHGKEEPGKGCMTSHLLGELLLTQFVESEELPGQDNVVNEATASQLHPDDDLAVRDHHGHRAKVNLQVFWKFLPPSIARVLRGNKS